MMDDNDYFCQSASWSGLSIQSSHDQYIMKDLHFCTHLKLPTRATRLMSTPRLKENHDRCYGFDGWQECSSKFGGKCLFRGIPIRKHQFTNNGAIYAQASLVIQSANQQSTSVNYWKLVSLNPIHPIYHRQ